VAQPDTRPISFTYPPMASMWVVTLHSLFLHSDPPLHCHTPSYWLRLFSNQTFSRINTPTFSTPVIQGTLGPDLWHDQSRPSAWLQNPYRKHIPMLEFRCLLQSPVMQSNAGMADRQGGGVVRPQLTLWLGLVWPQLFFIRTCLWRWNRQCVPKRRHIKVRLPGITQKKA